MCEKRKYWGVIIFEKKVALDKLVWLLEVRDGSEKNGTRLEVLTSTSTLAKGLVVEFNIGIAMIHGKAIEKAIEVRAMESPGEKRQL